MTRLFALISLLFAAPLVAQQFDPFHEARIDRKPGVSIPMDGRFLDQTGKIVTLRGLAAGKPLLLVPVLHECPNFCGVTLAGISQALPRLPSGTEQGFATVAFGIDPREGPRDAQADLTRLKSQTGHSIPPRTYALTGDAATIRNVTDALGYHYAWDARIGQYAHAAAFAVITPQGKLSRWFYGLSPDPAKLSQALVTAQQDKSSTRADQLLLVCFHYDPQSGKYTLAITRALRLAGLLTICTLAITILAMRQRKVR